MNIYGTAFGTLRNFELETQVLVSIVLLRLFRLECNFRKSTAWRAGSEGVWRPAKGGEGVRGAVVLLK